jgi:hypothetical protein
VKQRGRVSAASLSVVPFKAAATLLQPPADLSKAERELFCEIVASCHREHFVDSDRHLLASYVQAIVASRQFAKRLAKNPKLTTSWQQVTRTQSMLATKLRLAPRSRFDERHAARKSRQHNRVSAYDMLGDADD